MSLKQILVIHDREADDTDYSCSELLNKNVYLHNILKKYKNKITAYYKNKLWDRYKKLANEYEMIFTTPNTGLNISLYCPVSRSFFKMWEILYDFSEKEFKMVKDKPINAICLAEGPGGFVEALVKFRDNSEDKYYGISLKSSNKNIPEWKYQNRVKICYGADNTGDLYQKKNLDYLSENLPLMDIITADGGFDFSNDFNAQEELSVRLILCEIYAALTMQADDGSFVLKLYDIFHEYTLKIITLIKMFYEYIYIVKPQSSRPANSEKYLVCTGFKKKNLDMIKFLGDLIANYNDKNVRLFFDKIEHNSFILHNLVCYNIYYTLRQIYYIEQTIYYINEFGKNHHDDIIKNKIKEINEKHRNKSKNWCEKYKIEHI
jgi:23S rRNA U2552 (ribose-2'-O)-methylase RlmE/FtsJ